MAYLNLMHLLRPSILTLYSTLLMQSRFASQRIKLRLQLHVAKRMSK